jgi:cytochrome c oxidase cbb3-type subunit III
MFRVRDPFVGGLLALAIVAPACAQLFAAKSPAPATRRALQDENPTGVGKKLFESSCAACHGLDGHGGERAPDIATSAKTQGRSDEQLFRIVTRGLPATGMPAFASLSTENRKNVVAYLRLLQGKIVEEAKLPGDPHKGRELFFGKARCGECHTVAGSGGFIGQDLSTFGAARSIERIRDAIVNPENGGRRVTLVSRHGQSYSGVLRNEDNFSVQIQAMDGAFHLFDKSTIQRFTREPGLVMPADYGSTLSASELDDLISFLVTAGRQAKALMPSDKKVHDEGADDDE